MKKLIGGLLILLVLCVGALGTLLYYRATHPAATTAPSASNREAAGAMGEFTVQTPPLPAPELAFTARDGKPAGLADFHGKAVLLNLWATWCVPCIEEMPALERLQAKLGGRLTVLALSEDAKGEDVVAPFLDKHGLKGLAIYLDPKNAALKDLKVRGLPTSFLIDADGRVVAKLEGAAAWDSPAMLAKLEPYLPKP